MRKNKTHLPKSKSVVDSTQGTQGSLETSTLIKDKQRKRVVANATDMSHGSSVD